MEGHLEMAKFEIAFGNFSPFRNFNLGRPPTRITPQKKISLYFSTTFSQPSKVVHFLTLPPFERTYEPSLLFERAFEPSLPFKAPMSPRFFSSAPLSPHFLSSAPLSPQSFKVVRFLTLPPFERAFKPSTILLSAPSSPHLL